MSESAEGGEVTATRQNGGRDLTNAAVCGEFSTPGMVSAPAATDCAVVIFACGRASLARASQESAERGADCANALQERKTATSDAASARPIFIVRSLPKIIS